VSEQGKRVRLGHKKFGLHQTIKGCTKQKGVHKAIALIVVTEQFSTFMALVFRKNLQAFSSPKKYSRKKVKIYFLFLINIQLCVYFIIVFFFVLSP